MTFLQILILGAIQGAAELLPVSSSAHVIIAEKLMGLDPSSPEMTFLLVMLHTGTMFAVIVYFWKSWRQSYFSSLPAFWNILRQVVLATAITLVLGYGLKFVIEKIFLHGQPKAEVETLFSNLPLIAAALAAAGVLIIIAGLRRSHDSTGRDIDAKDSAFIGAIQGLCLPFRGFSRSGATISTGLLLGINKIRAEEFSFALAVVLTPFAVLWELMRLLKANAHAAQPVQFVHLMLPSLIGMVCSFVAGLLALRLLSRWLEAGKWHYFGYYCLAAAAVVFALALHPF